MKSFVKQSLLTVMMLFGMMGAWAQTQSDEPVRQTDGSWRVQAMPRGNRVLRTTWKQEAGLAWKIGTDPVPTQGVSGYLGFGDPAHVNFPTLDNPKNCTVHYGSSNVAVATIEANGAISFLSAGTTTIYAVHYTNEDEYSYYYDSVYYTLTVKTPPTLTLAATGSGTVSLSQVFTSEFTDCTAVDYSWHTGEMPLDFVPITATEAMTWTEAPQGTTSYLIYGIEEELFHCVKYAPNEETSAMTINYSPTAARCFYTTAVPGGVTGPVATQAGDVYTILPGTKVTATATANVAGQYHFVNWTNEGGTEYTTGINTDTEHGNYPQNSLLTLTVTGDTTTQANFQLNSYTITFNTNGGTINAGDVNGYTYGMGATLPTNVTKTGYTFGGWYDNAGLTGDAVTNISTTETGNKEFWAKWTINNYEIATIVTPTNSGTVTGGGDYNHFLTCTLTATPEAGYHFVNWTNNLDNTTSTVNPLEFTVTQAITYTANFAEDPVLTLVADGNGTVTLATPLPNGVFAIENDPQSGAERYSVPPGTEVTVTATPAEHYYMQKWTAGNNVNIKNSNAVVDTTFTVTETMTLTATFAAKPTLTLVADPTDGGRVEMDGAVSRTSPWSTKMFNYCYRINRNHIPTTDESCTISQFNNPFDATSPVGPWKVEYVGDYSSPDNTFGFDADGIAIIRNDLYHLNANQPVPMFQLYQWNSTFNDYQPAGYGTVYAYSNENNSVDHAAFFVLSSGLEIILTGNEYASSSLTITFDKDLSTGLDTIINATTTNLPNGVVEGNNANEYIVDYGTEVAVKATANPLYFVSGWEDELQHTLATATYSNYAVTNPNKFPALSSLTFTVTGDTTAKGIFGINDYMVSASVAEGQGERGTVQIAYTDGDNQAQIIATTATVTSVQATALGGSSTIVTATPNYGYVFSQWNNNVTTPTCTTTVAAEYTASFGYRQFNITAQNANNTMGTVSGSSTANYLSYVTLKATPSIGFHFVEWTNAAGTVIGTQSTITIQVLRDSVITAHFAANPLLTLGVNDLNMGNVSIVNTHSLGSLAKSFECTSNSQSGVFTDGTYIYTSCRYTNISDGYMFHKYNADGDSIDAFNIDNLRPLCDITSDGTYFYGVADGKNKIYKLDFSTTPTLVDSITCTEGLYHISYDPVRDAFWAGSTQSLALYDRNGNKIQDGPPISFIVTGTAYYQNGDEHLLLFNRSSNREIVVTDYHITNNYIYQTPVLDCSTQISDGKSEGSFIGMYNNQLCWFGDIGRNSNSNVIRIYPITGFNSIVNHNDGTYSVYPGTEVIVKATPKTGYHLASWTPAHSTNQMDTAHVTVTTNTSLTANFAANVYTVTLRPNDGTINEGNVTSYTYGEGATLPTNVTKTGYTFGGWYANAGLTGEAVTDILTTETGNKEFWAKWTANTYTLTLDNQNATTAGSESVTATYESSTLPSITNPKREGYTFEGWYSGEGGTGTLVINTSGALQANTIYTNASGQWTSTSDQTLYAKWTINSYTLTVNYKYINDDPAATTHTETVVYNTPYSVESPAITGYTPNKAIVAGTMGAGNVTVDVIYSINNYAIAATANPTTGGSIDGAGSYDHFASCTLIATPATGYHFVNWTENNTVVSTSATYGFTVTGARTLVANFAVNVYDVTVNVTKDNQHNNVAMGTVQGPATLEHFATANYTATANYGYHFVNWTNTSNEVLGTESTYNLSGLSDGYTLNANFTYNQYTVTAQSANSTMGTATGTATVNYLTNVTLTATPNYGYHFVNWTNAAGTVLGTETTVTVQALRDSVITANFTYNTYTVTAQSANETMGTASGTATVNYLSTVTLTATPNYGYHFVNWTNAAGTVLGTETSLTVQALRDSVITANFDTNTYALNVQSVDAAMGSVSGSNPAAKHFLSYEISATANEGYHFVQWQDGNSDNPRTVTLTQAATYTASFDTNTYALNVQSTDVAMGSVSGGNPAVKHFLSYEISATPNNGCHFVQWNDGNTDNPRTVTLSSDSTFTATFAATPAELAWSSNDFTGYTYIDFNNWKPTLTNPHNVSVRYGCVEGNQSLYGGILCDAQTGTIGASSSVYGYIHGVAGTYHIYAVHETDQTYYYDSVVYTLHVLPSAEVGLTKNIDEGGVVSMPDYTDESTLTNLYITVNGTPFAYVAQGYSVRILAEPATGYHFGKWTLSQSDLSSNAAYTYQAPATITGNLLIQRIQAVFDTNTYALNVQSTDVAMGSVSGSNPAAKHFLSYEISATANEGYHFVQWQDGNSDNPRTVTLSSDSTFTANFDTLTYDITASVNPAEGGTVEGTGAYKHFKTATLTATPATGRYFVSWTENDQVVSTSTTYSFMVEGARTLVANFDTLTYNITASVNPAEGGTVEGAGTYKHFKTATLTATPATGRYFVSWTENDQVVSTSTSYSFTVEGARTLVANFDTLTYNIAASVNPAEGGTVEGAGNYKHFKTATLTATPATGRYFVSWTENDQVVSTSTSYSFMVEGSRTLVANFDTLTYNITASVNPTEGGNVTGADYYKHFTTATLTATPATGYHFVNWTENNEVVEGAGAQYTFIVIGAKNLVANFDLNTYTIAATVSPENTGNVNGMGTYNHGATATLTASPAEHYSFVNWTEGENVVSTDANYSFTVEGGRTLVANFKLNSYEVNASVANTADVRGSVQIGYTDVNGQSQTTAAGATAQARAQSGTTSTLTAIPAMGYHFVNWQNAGTAVSSSNPLSFTATADTSLTALFDVNSYTITYMDGETELNVDTFDYRQPITEYSTSKEGWRFEGWNPEVPQLMPAENMIVYAQWYRLCEATVTDIDHNTYSTVNIGNKCWMTENMRATHYYDGREITNIYEYVCDRYPNAEANMNIFGRLYDWYDAADASRPTRSVRIQGICPEGWFLPNEEDFETLSNVELQTLLSTNYWLFNVGNNNTGFDLRPTGMYNFATSRYEDLRGNAYLWSSFSTSDTEAHCHMADCHCYMLVDLIYNKNNAFSVRCVKD
ncbi:MAG: InlB B-repeat-containing protein [Bacteroidales bacterium]|nr:InlB B-repeat-containing protein [Bacteroidales bacterium]